MILISYPDLCRLLCGHADATTRNLGLRMRAREPLDPNDDENAVQRTLYQR